MLSRRLHLGRVWSTRNRGVVAQCVSSPCVVRRAKVADTANMAMIDLACVQQGSSGWSEATFTSTIQNAHALAWVVEMPTMQASKQWCMAGFVSAMLVAGELQVENFAVTPEHQRKSLGRVLLANLLAAAQCQDTPCYLEVKTTNSAAVRLYTSMGFESAGLRKKFYPDGSDALLMVRPAGPLHESHQPLVQECA